MQSTDYAARFASLADPFYFLEPPVFPVGYGPPSLGPVYAYSPVLTAWREQLSLERPGFAVDDETVRELVYQTLDTDPTIPDVDVNVEVNAGVVTLTGRVPGKRTKHAIGDAAWWIPAVVDVNNQVEVTRSRERRLQRARAAA